MEKCNYNIFLYSLNEIKCNSTIYNIQLKKKETDASYLNLYPFINQDNISIPFSQITGKLNLERTEGELDVSLLSGILPITNGGTGANSLDSLKTSLGLKIYSKREDVNSNGSDYFATSLNVGTITTSNIMLVFASVIARAGIAGDNRWTGGMWLVYDGNSPIQVWNSSEIDPTTCNFTNGVITIQAKSNNYRTDNPMFVKVIVFS